MRKLTRLAGGTAALALVAVGTSCGQQSPQQPHNQAQQPEPQRPQAQQAQTQTPEPPQPQAQQAQKQPEPQQPQTQQAQNPTPQSEPQSPESQKPEPQQQQVQKQPEPQPPPAEKQTEPQQPQAQNPQSEPQPSQSQQAQNPQVQRNQQPANENANESGSQITAENPSQSEIREIQRALEQKGFRVGYRDGILGPMTKRALSQFQRKQRLPQTGMPDEPTLAALGLSGGANSTGQGPSTNGGMNAPINNPSPE